MRQLLRIVMKVTPRIERRIAPAFRLAEPRGPSKKLGEPR